MKVVAIIQARMGSSRLPGKVMKELQDDTVLSHVIRRVKQSKWIDKIVIATTKNQQDQQIVLEAVKNRVEAFQGDESNVLERYFLAAKYAQADVVVRITSDCPLIDPYVIDKLVKCFDENNYLLVTNAGADTTLRTFPRGLDVEVFSFEALENSYQNANLDYQKEHVTPYLYENEDKVYYFTNKFDHSDYRLTLDTFEDWKLIEEIYHELYHGNHNFYMKEIIDLLKRRPLLNYINKHVEQKKLK
ncbi:cytidylyltransferase domain-containing protein [Gracilibacillus timonensis]|uniref:cytidylyltransferase domain-containing protein n=1 Tax=Gracilibacillus timonensis TaxID=1816696 RepID=UPI000826C25E|nr:glycosyltransferase family protein [Gracilibacillus timonensis]